MLDLSKIEAGKMEIESVKFDIRNEVDEIFSLFDEKVSNKQLEMAALIHDSVPSCMMGDPTRIRQVWFSRFVGRKGHLDSIRVILFYLIYLFLFFNVCVGGCVLCPL